MRSETGKYMMATTAFSSGTPVFDISRDEPDLCIIFDEDADNYIGNWVEGFGFVDVRFPKTTTKALTAEDVNEYHGMHLSLAGRYIGDVDLKSE